MDDQRAMENEIDRRTRLQEATDKNMDACIRDIVEDADEFDANILSAIEALAYNDEKRDQIAAAYANGDTNALGLMLGMAISDEVESSARSEAVELAHIEIAG